MFRTVDTGSIGDAASRRNPKNTSGTPAFFCSLRATLSGWIGCAASRAEKGSQPAKHITPCSAGLKKDDIAGNGELHLRAGVSRARQRKAGTDAHREFLHALQSEVPVSSAGRYLRLNAFAIIADTHHEIAGVVHVYFEARASGVGAGVANGLVSDAIDLIAHDGMHLLSRAIHQQDKLHGAVRTAFPGCAFEGLGEVVYLNG